jgi:hypothetical protein
MSCTKYYKTGESIYSIDSRKVPMYGEIKDFYAWITTAPILLQFSILLVYTFLRHMEFCWEEIVHL